MVRGCLMMLALFAVVLALEWQAVAALDLPWRGALATLLALTATLALGSLQGIAQAWRQRGTPQDAPSTWREGALVRVQGTLQAAATTTPAPFSQRAAVYLDYGAWTADGVPSVRQAQQPHWRGFVAVPALLQTAGGAIPLRGMPPPRHWPEQQMAGEPGHTRAARHLASTAWQRAPDIALTPLDTLVDAGITQAQPGGGVSQHLMNAEAAELLGLTGGRPDEAALRRRLGERAWTFTERVVPPGALVTVVGTFHAQPRHLDVSLSPRHPEHALHLGAAAALARGQWRTTLVFALLLVALAAAAHALVHLDDGARLRRLLATLETLA